MKRFWKTVSVEAGGVLLDGRPLRTPARVPLVLPNAALAEVVAAEWRDADERVDPRTMPFTGLANAAIDQVAPYRASFAASLAHYGETDLLCYRADADTALAAHEAAVWDPLLDWARARYDIAFVVTAGIVHKRQPAATVRRLAGAVDAFDQWQLAALSPLVTIGGSLVVALMIADAAIAPEAAFDACHLDELWQAEHWGEDAEAAAAREARRTDFLRAAAFLAQLRGPLPPSA